MVSQSLSKNVLQLLSFSHIQIGNNNNSYASDITCSFPANGKFSAKYLPIYNAVLEAQITVYEMLKPRVSWVDCHKAAEVRFCV
jgi:Xaa-Pro aminopeptidase